MVYSNLMFCYINESYYINILNYTINNYKLLG